MKNKSQLFVSVVSLLAILHALTILLSWVASALFPSYGIRSLLGNEGLRWLLTSMDDNLSSPVLMWMLVAGMVLGMFYINGFPKRLLVFFNEDPRDKFAMKIFFLEIFAGVILCFVLAFWPHSIALGVSGHLFPGPFVDMVVTVMSLTSVVANVSFVMLSGSANKCEKVEKALTFGIQTVAPLIVIYFLLKEWLEMLLFVL